MIWLSAALPRLSAADPEMPERHAEQHGCHRERESQFPRGRGRDLHAGQ